MKKAVHVSKYVFVLLSLLSLSGCWDQKEIDQKAFVVAIGLDKGEKNQIKISYLIANPEYGSQQGGGASSEPPSELISLEANDLITSRNLANSVVAKEITYDLLSVLVVSEDFAKDKNFLRWMYDATKDREIKRSTPLLVSREKAFKFLTDNKSKLETRPHKYFNLMFENDTKTGLIPEAELIQYFRITEADADLFLSVYGSTKNKGKEQDGNLLAGEFKTEGKTNKTKFLGSAVFKEGKMIGTLTGEETRLSLLLNEALQNHDFVTTFEDPFNKKYRITTRIIKMEKNEAKMVIKNGKPTMYINVPLKIEVLTDHSMVNYAKNVDKRDQLKAFLNKRITGKMEKLIKKTQKDFKGEPFGWSLIARRSFLTIPEYEKFDWMKSYPNMNVEVSVDIKFGEFGRQGELPKLKKVRD